MLYRRPNFGGIEILVDPLGAVGGPSIIYVQRKQKMCDSRGVDIVISLESARTAPYCAHGNCNY